jgi:predicted amidophosphoribosyltransferase
MSLDSKSSEPLTLRCPVCGAGQVWNHTCRRCRAELSSVVELERQKLVLKLRALANFAALDGGDPQPDDKYSL